MRHSPTFIEVAAILLTSLLLGACGGAPTAPPLQNPSPEPFEQASGIVVVDALRHTLQFPQPPQRIVVAGKSSLTIVETFYLFPEAKERVVALVSSRQKPGDFLAFVDPAFSQKTLLEADAGPEQIAPHDPDVVIMRSFMAETLGRTLQELDIPVVYVDLETPEQYFRDVTTLGQLLGNKARAEEIQAFYRSYLDDVAQPLQGLSKEQKPRVLVLQYSDIGGQVTFNVPPASWIQTAEAELAGGIPVWKEAAQGGGWMAVNLEQIAAWAPDIVFVVHYGADSAEIADRLKADPQWQALKAVKKGQIYGFASDIFSWDQPEPRWILGVTWLAGKTHPDRFPDLNMMHKVSRFFIEMYGMEETSTKAHILPHLKGDIE